MNINSIIENKNYRNCLLNNWEQIKEDICYKSLMVKIDEEDFFDSLVPDGSYRKNKFYEIGPFSYIDLFTMLYINGSDKTLSLNKYGTIVYNSFINRLKKLVGKDSKDAKLYNLFSWKDYYLLLTYNAFSNLFSCLSEEEIKVRTNQSLVLYAMDMHIKFEKYIKDNNRYNIEELKIKDLELVAKRFLNFNNEVKYFKNLVNEEINNNTLKDIFNDIIELNNNDLDDLFHLNLPLFCDTCFLCFMFMSRIVYLNFSHNIIRRFNFKIFKNKEEKPIIDKTIKCIDSDLVKLYIESTYVYKLKEKFNTEDIDYTITEVTDEKDIKLNKLLDSCKKFLGDIKIIDNARWWNNLALYHISKHLLWHFRSPETRYEVVDLAINISKLNIDDFFDKIVNKKKENCYCHPFMMFELLRDVVTTLFNFKKHYNIEINRKFNNVPLNYPYDEKCALEYIKKGCTLLKYVDGDKIYPYLYGSILYKEILTKNTKQEGLNIINDYNNRLNSTMRSSLDAYLSNLKKQREVIADECFLEKLDNKINKFESFLNDVFPTN